MSTNVAEPQGTPTGSPPDTKGGNGAPKLYTEEEVTARLRGQGTKLSELEAELKKFRDLDEQRKTAELSTAEQLLKTKNELETTAKRAKELEDRETARLERVQKSNEKRLEALPKEVRPPIDGLDPDKASDLLDWAERTVATRVSDVHGGTPRGGKPLTPEEQEAQTVEKKRAAGRDFVFGKKDSK